ncbi:hypothetical protein ACIBQ6_15105 [Nonomuraea sp. NPDC049655]|uniref:hypothetical protein n=1 Tax=Nonomuraea sp. NPDC049655 TaxID=3364355 RepID=UPI0037938CB8
MRKSVRTLLVCGGVAGVISAVGIGVVNAQAAPVGRDNGGDIVPGPILLSTKLASGETVQIRADRSLEKGNCLDVAVTGSNGRPLGFMGGCGLYGDPNLTVQEARSKTAASASGLTIVATGDMVTDDGQTLTLVQGMVGCGCEVKADLADGGHLNAVVDPSTGAFVIAAKQPMSTSSGGRVVRIAAVEGGVERSSLVPESPRSGAGARGHESHDHSH